MAAAVDPYQLTATGVLGDRRETMLENPLLLRGELGKPMRRGYTNYPGEELRYGRQNVSNDGGAPEALRGWASGVHFPKLSGANGSGDKARGGADRDFMALNRCAVQAGLTTASENYQFRAMCDIRKKQQADGGGGGGGKTMTRRLPPSQVYGVATRPSTPIHDLLEHKYQDKWLQERRGLDASAKSSSSIQLKPGKVYETRASLLRTHIVPVQKGALWQMPRFANSARPHLETFRTEDAKSKAFKNYQSDCISRRGVFGQGAYEQAVN